MSPDTVSFSVRRESPGPSSPVYEFVQIMVNGRDFLDTVREFEMPMASAEGHPGIAGDYIGLPPQLVFLPARRFLGAHEWLGIDRWVEDNLGIALYACGSCALIGCWPLTARIAVDKDFVVWKDFAQPHRVRDLPNRPRWRYGKFGPFRFDKKAYLRALCPEVEPLKKRVDGPRAGRREAVRHR